MKKFLAALVPVVAVTFLFAVRQHWIDPVGFFTGESRLSRSYADQPPAFYVVYQLDWAKGGGLSLSPARKAVADSKILETIAADLNARLKLDRYVVIIVKQCGFPNAMYRLEQKDIILCDEMVGLLEQVFSSRPAAQFDQAVLGATTFFVLHEVGHALVHQFGLPVLGGEESAVDSLATYLLIESGAADVAMRGAESFAALSEARPPTPFWDEHPLDAQRFYDIACWLYGADQQRWGFLAREGLLPAPRAEGCPASFERLSASVKKVLAPHWRGGKPLVQGH